ncbi:MAG: hypothetical protein KDA84_30850, partial [Planctomycetaceae bacterium]|nr:hypothetical protein [Planctomycetaceae bacterium]
MKPLICLITLLLPLTANAALPEIVPQLGHSDQVHSVSFSPNGKFVLTGSVDATTKIWDA